MRIAIFHELPPGGARRAINEFSRELKKNNLVDLYLVDNKEIIEEEKFYSNVNLYKFLPKAWSGGNWTTRVYKDTIELVKLYLLNKKIARKIDGKKYDIVLVSASRNIESPFIMRFLKTPFVFYIHDPFYRIIYDPMLNISKNIDSIRYNYERLNRFVRKILDKQNVNNAKLCVCPSKFIANLFSKTYGKKCDVVYYGVNTNLFKIGKFKKEIDILYVGSYSPIDGYSLLEQSIKFMKHKVKVKALMAEIEWISDDKKLVELYQKSKVLMEIAFNEGLGAASLEAMACGTPVIATDDAGHKETVVDGVNGYLLPRSPKLFAQKLDWLFSNPKQLEKISKNARKIVLKKWIWSDRSKDLFAVFRNFLANNRYGIS